MMVQRLLTYGFMINERGTPELLTVSEVFGTLIMQLNRSLSSQFSIGSNNIASRIKFGQFGILLF